jgi:flagellar biosynthesis/type III secretory pathway protein FliH
VLTRARVIRAGTADARPLAGPPLDASPAQKKRLARERIEAELEAERITTRAKERVDAILAHAREASAAAVERAAQEAREAEETKLAAAWLVLRKREGERAERDLDRAIALAVALAERLVGASLELDPSRIAALAREALAEARGARRVTIDAHPLDADALRAGLDALGLPSADVRASEGLARGELCLHTDLGTLDAKLHPRLERLAAALRDALR